MSPLFPAFGFALFASAATAHVSLDQPIAEIGATTKITLRVPHGCEGEATNAVRMTLPDGIYNAKPMPKAGWMLDTVTGAYDAPFDNHGTQMTEGVRQIIWSGGNLEDAWYDEFTFRASVGPDLAPGTTLFFPTVQDCATGASDWTDTTGSHDVPNPAPKLTVIAGGGGHAEHAMHMPEAASDITVGDLTISGLFSRATLPNAPVAGGFLSITNDGPQDDRLIAVASEAAGRAEIHEMAMDGDVMRMRKLPDGLSIPAGETVDLKPGGFHLMLMDLAHPLTMGETVAVTLTFEKAGTVEVLLPIGAPNAREPGHDHDHGKMEE